MSGYAGALDGEEWLTAKAPTTIWFWAGFYKEPNTGCWIWERGIDHHGYGGINIARGKMVKAHRFSWELHNGPIPPGLNVLHKCDTRPCVNPDHLYLGSQADNLADAKRKGRTAKGVRNGSARLTEAQVREIRASTEPARIVAERYGIHREHAAQIRRRRAWSWLP